MGCWLGGRDGGESLFLFVWECWLGEEWWGARASFGPMAREPLLGGDGLRVSFCLSGSVGLVRSGLLDPPNS